MSFYKTLFASPILSSSLALFFPPFISFFFFNDTATTEIYTLSLHDALPISVRAEIRDGEHEVERAAQLVEPSWIPAHERSEEHTSELQSQSNLVCRLLLEKKKKKER